MQQVLRIGDTVSFKDAASLRGYVSVFHGVTQEKLGRNYELTIVGYEQVDADGVLENEVYTPGFIVPNNRRVWVTAGISIPGFTRTIVYRGKQTPCIRLHMSLVEPYLFDDGLDNWV